MKSRRPKARIIGQSEEDDGNDAASKPDSSTTTVTTPVFKRKTSSNKARKSAGPQKVSMSYDEGSPGSPGNSADADDEDSSSAPVVIRKPMLARQAIERNAVTKAHGNGVEQQQQHHNQHQRKEGGGGLAAAAAVARNKPSIPAAAASRLEQLSLASSGGALYSREALEELRTSTPTTPRDVGSRQRSPEDAEMADVSSPASNDPLNVASKFGGGSTGSSGGPGGGGIPDAATIRALKARRQQRRDNPDYISLTDGISNNSSSNRKKESRLKVVGDEDEMFESYVDDGGIALGKKAEAERDRRRREGIRDAIVEGEGGGTGGDDDDDDSSGSEETDSEDGGGDDDEFKAWETHQIRSGGFGTDVAQRETMEQRLRKPPATIVPLPNLADVIAKLETTLARMNEDKEAKSRVVENLAAKREEIERREKEVQEQLRVKGEAYERLKKEAGVSIEPGRGLESFGDDIPVASTEA